MVAERPLLLVDDEPELAPLLAAHLSRSGYVVVACGDGSAALAAIGTRRWAAAVIDLTLPDMHGADLAAALLARIPDLGIVLISGAAFDLAAAEPPLAGQMRFLSKPFRLEHLSAALDAVTRAF